MTQKGNFVKGLRVLTRMTIEKSRAITDINDNKDKAKDLWEKNKSLKKKEMH